MKISGQPSRGVHTVIFEHCLYTAVERAVPGRDSYLVGILTRRSSLFEAHLVDQNFVQVEGATLTLTLTQVQQCDRNAVL